MSFQDQPLVGDETPAERVARDLAYAQEGSPHLNARGATVAEAIDPEQDKLDEGDLSEYDQEQIAEDLHKEDVQRREQAAKRAADEE